MIGVISQRTACLTLFRGLLQASADGVLPGDDDCEALRVGMLDLQARDAVFMEGVIGNAEVAELICQGDTSQIPAAMVALVLGVERPDGMRLEALFNLMTIAGMRNGEPVEQGESAHTIAAFAAWYAGLNTLAVGAVEVALALNPEYRLAIMLQAALNCRMPPGWLR